MFLRVTVFASNIEDQKDRVKQLDVKVTIAMSFWPNICYVSGSPLLTLVNNSTSSSTNNQFTTNNVSKLWHWLDPHLYLIPLISYQLKETFKILFQCKAFVFIKRLLYKIFENWEAKTKGNNIKKSLDIWVNPYVVMFYNSNGLDG